MLEIVEIDVFGDELLYLSTGIEVSAVQTFSYQGVEKNFSIAALS